MDFYLGTVMAFAFNYAPQGWMACNGSLLAIRQNTALFALLGATYGGDGQTTFGVPDLQGRVAIGMGNGAGLPPYTIGGKAGTATVTLTVNNLAPHTHTGTLSVTGATRGPVTPAAGNLLETITTVPASTSGTVALGGVTTQPTGSGQAFSIMPPYLVLNYCICTQGVYPPRQ